MLLIAAEKFSTLHWLAVQLSYLACFFVLLAAVRIVWKPLKNVSASWKNSKPIQKAEKRAWLPVGNKTVLVGFILGGMVGYICRDVQQHWEIDSFKSGYQAREMEQFSNTHTMVNLRVISRTGQLVGFQKETYDGRKVGLVFSLRICDSFRPQWEPGNLLEQLTYEERYECENINYPQLGFTVHRDVNNVPVKLARR